jgi:hypothetical protein
VEQVSSIAKELLIKKGDDKSVGINWPQKFLKRHPQIKTAYVPSLDTERAMTQDHDILAGWFNLFQSLKEEHEIFAPLTTAYKSHVQRITRLEASYSIGKTNFLEIYQQARHEAITPLNIRKA